MENDAKGASHDAPLRVAIPNDEPSLFWVYSDEDLVGKMVEVAESCHASTTAAIALVKWLVAAFETSE